MKHNLAQAPRDMAPRHSRPLRRLGLPVVAAQLAVLSLVAGACGEPEGPPRQAYDAVARFADAWSSGRAASAVDRRTRPAASKALRELADTLLIESTKAAPDGRLTCLDDEQAEARNDGRKVCRQRLDVTHRLTGLGTWRYTTTVEVREDPQGKWAVWWTPETFHPKLTETTRFERHRTMPPRASITDNAGDPLTQDGPVVRVGVVPAKADPDMTYYELGRTLGVDAVELRKRAEEADPNSFVDVLTLREEAYDEVDWLLDQLPGVATRKAVMSLAPTSSYARGVLGVVAPATAETLKDAGPLAMPGDQVGVSGLQKEFQTRLAGRPGGSIDVIDVRNDEKVGEVFTVEPQPGQDLRTTLDPFIQEAAEQVVGVQEKPTTIVAVRASTGEILAAANGPGVTSYNRAFVGEYPPGSTFKVITAAALLADGLQLNSRVECPPETTVGGKRFKNANRFGLRRGPFVTAFAHSCNTTMVNRAKDLDPDALNRMARRFGVGAEWKLRLPAYSGSIPKPKDVVEHAASMIGQGRVLMSPLGMAMVAAAVASGQPRTPTLLPDVAPGEPIGGPLPAQLQTDLRALMRAVVESGSAKMLDLPGPPIHAKTGTAEYGTENPPRTHAWMIGFRGDMAIAVVIDDGGSGGRDAGPVAREFLRQTRFVD